MRDRASPARRRRLPFALLSIAVATVALPPRSGAATAPPLVVVGAKKFTEGAILAELMAQVLETHAGARVERRFNLAGTQVCFDALRSRRHRRLRGVYRHRPARHPARRLRVGLAGRRLRQGQRGVSGSLRADMAGSIRLQQHLRPDHAAQTTRTRSAFARSATWPATAFAMECRTSSCSGPTGCGACGTPTGSTRPIPSASSTTSRTRPWREGAIDVSDGYSTDAKIAGRDLVALRDDRGFFPPYEAAPVVRLDLLTRVPRRGRGAAPAGRADRRRDHAPPQLPGGAGAVQPRAGGFRLSARERSERRAGGRRSALHLVPRACSGSDAPSRSRWPASTWY